jgi:hypothetical protein
MGRMPVSASVCMMVRPLLGDADQDLKPHPGYRDGVFGVGGADVFSHAKLNR